MISSVEPCSVSRVSSVTDVLDTALINTFESAFSPTVIADITGISSNAGEKVRVAAPLELGVVVPVNILRSN